MFYIEPNEITVSTTDERNIRDICETLQSSMKNMGPKFSKCFKGKNEMG